MEPKHVSERKCEQLGSMFVMDIKLVAIDDFTPPDPLREDLPGSVYRLFEGFALRTQLNTFQILDEVIVALDVKIVPRHAVTSYAGTNDQSITEFRCLLASYGSDAFAITRLKEGIPRTESARFEMLLG